MATTPITLEKIAEVTGGKYFGPPELAGRVITGAVHDNRSVKGGELFVCIAGERVDGHSFAPDAIARGAAACLADEPLPETAEPYILTENSVAALQALARWYRGLFDIPFVGVVGSVGKTTAKEMTAAVLSQRYRILKTPANLNTDIGVPITLLSLREEHELAVIEMGISGFGEMRLLAELVRPSAIVFTNVAGVHLEFLGDLDGVLRAKSEVFEYMSPGSAAVMNGDDERLSAYQPPEGVEKLTFGFGPGCLCRAENIAMDGVNGVECDILLGGSTLHASIPAFGAHTVLGALPAVLLGRRFGLTDEEILRGLAAYRTVGGRANVSDTGFITLIDDCYNANPLSVAAALTSLCTLPARHVAILGDMRELGPDSPRMHFETGAAAAKKGVDLLICIGEDSAETLRGFNSAAPEKKALHLSDKSELTPLLPSLIERGDAVLVKASHSLAFETIVAELKELR